MATKTWADEAEEESTLESSMKTLAATPKVEAKDEDSSKSNLQLC
jgi:hypothetical protein